MARPVSKNVVLFRRGPTWWIRFTLRPGEVPHFKKSIALDARNRARYSLGTTNKAKAQEIANTTQALLDLARKQSLSHRAFHILTGDQGKVAKTIAEFLEELGLRDRKRGEIGATCTNPIEARNKHALQPRTVKRYALIRQYFIQFLQAKHPGEVFYVSAAGLDSDSRPHLLQFRTWFFDERHFGRMTYKQARAYFSEAWQSVAIPQRYAETNPWRDPQLRPPRGGETPREILTQEQRAALLSMPSTWHYNALKILLLTGHRVTELCWLQPGDVDVKAKTVRWLNSKTGRYETLPATDDELAILAVQMKEPALWIFPRGDGQQCEGHFMETKLGRALQRALKLKKCLLPHVSPQSLRRTWQTIAARKARTDPHAIKDLMMHKSLDQQLTYIQADVEALRESAAAVQRQIKGA